MIFIIILRILGEDSRLKNDEVEIIEEIKGDFKNVLSREIKDEEDKYNCRANNNDSC